MGQPHFGFGVDGHRFVGALSILHLCVHLAEHLGRTMVSTPYTRGRSREYQVLHKLREEGWFCSRSAASHGPVDIFAGRGGHILMVQVKSGTGRASETERRILKLWGEAFHGRVEIWRYRKGRPLEKETVYDHEEN